MMAVRTTRVGPSFYGSQRSFLATSAAVLLHPTGGRGTQKIGVFVRDDPITNTVICQAI